MASTANEDRPHDDRQRVGVQARAQAADGGPPGRVGGRVLAEFLTSSKALENDEQKPCREAIGRLSINIGTPTHAVAPSPEPTAVKNRSVTLVGPGLIAGATHKQEQRDRGDRAPRHHAERFAGRRCVPAPPPCG